LSLGAVCPSPATAWRGTIVNPARVIAEVPRNPRRLMVLEDFVIINGFFIWIFSS
jgi:hypothetical protein